jgi:hypothetical protein
VKDAEYNKAPLRWKKIPIYSQLSTEKKKVRFAALSLLHNDTISAPAAHTPAST